MPNDLESQLGKYGEVFLGELRIASASLPVESPEELELPTPVSLDDRRRRNTQRLLVVAAAVLVAIGGVALGFGLLPGGDASPAEQIEDVGQVPEVYESDPALFRERLTDIDYEIGLGGPREPTLEEHQILTSMARSANRMIEPGAIEILFTTNSGYVRFGFVGLPSGAAEDADAEPENCIAHGLWGDTPDMTCVAFGDEGSGQRLMPFIVEPTGGLMPSCEASHEFLGSWAGVENFSLYAVLMDGAVGVVLTMEDGTTALIRPQLGYLYYAGPRAVTAEVFAADGSSVTADISDCTTPKVEVIGSSGALSRASDPTPLVERLRSTSYEVSFVTSREPTADAVAAASTVAPLVSDDRDSGPIDVTAELHRFGRSADLVLFEKPGTPGENQRCHVFVDENYELTPETYFASCRVTAAVDEEFRLPYQVCNYLPWEEPSFEGTPDPIVSLAFEVDPSSLGMIFTTVDGHEVFVRPVADVVFYIGPPATSYEYFTATGQVSDNDVATCSE